MMNVYKIKFQQEVTHVAATSEEEAIEQYCQDMEYDCINEYTIEPVKPSEWHKVKITYEEGIEDSNVAYYMETPVKGVICSTEFL